MYSRLTIARALAESFASADADDKLLVEQLVECGTQLLGRRWRWLRPLARRILTAFPDGAPLDRLDLERFLLCDRGFLRAAAEHPLQLLFDLEPPAMLRPIATALASPAPPIGSPGALAEWLELTHTGLDWFADLRAAEAHLPCGPLRHYRYRLLRKPKGVRLVEAPKPRLKEMQRRILREILDPVPPHPAAHGFRRGRSTASFAEPHVKQEVVLKLDLEDFFPTIRAAQVAAIFRGIGYPLQVAEFLTGLCTNTAPGEVFSRVERNDFTPLPLRSRSHQARLYRRPHLPQGAPTSPALGNLCAYRMDARLAGLAAAANATYTRYADDLAFSGGAELARCARRFLTHAAAIVMEEGFTVNHHKTRVMRRGAQQRIAGLVVNERLNAPRREFDRLKATLTNCVRHGPTSQNRDAHSDFRSHLEGRLAYLERLNPGKARKLRRVFERIRWSDEPAVD